ncbi:MAG: 3-deoxy-manno-octulosonate cytidylyltransferase [Alphaproteobacteria bacterium]|nr:3-deoxy-manno-octulosonate cytidylyltransferase [Alphaproteobacteria bacterium]
MTANPTPSIAIIIPARYASTRFPGKPLAKIGGKTMLERVVHLARYASIDFPNIGVCVATDHPQIQKHCKQIDVPSVLTDPRCATGSDRALASLKGIKDKPDFILNLQGDAPFTEPMAVKRIIEAFLENPKHEVITPIHRLSWSDLDRLRENKKTTPFSGTTAIVDETGRALWFSKNILPAIRNEKELREQGQFSPVNQHIGLYGYRTDILEKFCHSKPSRYETLEGLEQLRLLENGIKVQTVEIELLPGRIQSGIDTAEDVERAEANIRRFGDPINEQRML